MSKKGAVTLLFVLALAMAICGQAFAAVSLEATAGTNTIASQVAGKKNVVLTAFTATHSGAPAPASGIQTITVENPGSAGGLELARLALYRDVNGDGKFDSGDTLVAGAATAATVNYSPGVGVVTLDPDSDETLAVGQSKKYLIVADLSKTIGAMIDGDSFGVTLGGTETGGAGLVAGAGLGFTQPAIVFDIKATHLKFYPAGYNAIAAAGGQLLVDAQDFLGAVDDYGNVDTGYTSVIKLTAVDPSTGVDITGGLTATSGVAGGTIVTVAGQAMQLGLIQTDLAGAANKMFNMTYASAYGGVTLVATGPNTAAGGNIQGSTTVFIGAAYPATAPIVNLARGTEVYDVDHNGHIDHMTIFFDKPVDLNGVTDASFTISGGYTLTGTPETEFDAGGVGIRNAGEFGVTVALVEKDVFDTNIKPDLTYNATTIMRAMGAGAFAGSVGSAQSVEVDKARPVLISAVTKDAGIGTGTASNGIIDGLVFTFSEPIRNVRAGAALSANGASATGFINIALPVATGMSFNQGNGTSAANVHTIPVQETTINTGVTPDVLYNEDATQADVRITDFATAATGAIAYNLFYVKNTSFAVTAIAEADEATIKTTDGAPMVVHSVETLDNDANGKLDRIRVTFSEKTTAAAITVDGVDFYSSTASFASGANANGVYTPTAVSGNDSPTLTFVITEVTVAGVYDTEATPLFRYDPNFAGASIKDAVGNPLGAYGPGGLSHTATKDMAAPVIVKFTTSDAYSDTAYAGDSTFEAVGANGRIDQITMVFSEKVQSGEGAQLGGTALDHAIGQFTVTHPDGGARVKMLTTATLGKPAWTDKDSNGDTSTEIVVPFQEVSMGTAGLVNHGDTGKIPALAYAASGTSAYNIKDIAAEPNSFTTILAAAGKDGAKPFVVNGLDFGSLAFANITTKDTPVTAPAPVPAGVSNSADGDGFIDAYILNFSEAVAVPSGTSDAFTVDLPGDGALAFAGANTTAAVSVVTVAGTNDKKSGADTAVTPAISFNPDKQTIQDAAGNKVAAFTDRGAYDGAPAVIVSVNGDTAAANKLNFTFSEPVFAHDADGKNISFNATSIASSSLFGYDNLGAGPGSSGFTAAVVTQPSAKVLQATMNANLTVVDIASDLVWVRTSTIFDDANAVQPALADNVTLADVAGANLKFWIMDDVVAPWIVGAKTIDYDLDGKIDHIRVQLSEPIDDSTIKGFVSNNAMSNDVAATWKLSGYTGPVRWNFFDGTTDAGKAASIAASKPAFADNAADNNVLYLEVDEELVPANVNSGVGTTGFKPTITWGTGADAETLGDFRPNLLNTAKNAADVDDALGLEPTNGVVEDKVGPVIVGASYNSTGKVFTVLFSEPVKDNTAAFKSSDFAISGSNNVIWGYSWTNNSTVDITMKSDYSLTANAATTVAIAPGGPTYAKLNDAADNVAGLAADTNTTSLWDAQSPVAPAPYTAKTITRNAFKVTNNTWITFRDIGDTEPAAGESVRIRWYYANVDSIDIAVSFNNQETWEVVPGLRTAASAGQVNWTAKMGVTNVRIQSATAAGTNAVTTLTGVVFNQVVEGAIGAPSALTMTDIPGDNGGFVVAKFKVSADNLTAVNTYQFYRQMVLGTADTTWVLWAVVPAGAPDAAGKMAVIVPTANNKTSKWAVRASTTKVVSSQVVAAKEAEVPVAEVVFVEGAVSKAAADVVSAMSEVVEAASVDNIAPSAISTISASSAGSGVQITWVAPADHGIVASYTLAGTTGFVYGVDKYEVYRKTGTGEFALVGEAPKGSTSFVDPVAAGATVYQYMVKAMDSAFTVQTNVPGNAMSLSGIACDLNGDRTVGLGDLVLLGSNWDVKSTDAKFIAAFDFNKDGAIGLGDLVLLGNAWTPASKVAKAAPAAGVAFDLNAEYNADNSTYFVTVSPKDVSGINGIGFSMKYDAEKYEFVSESVSGLSGDVKIVKADQGIVDIASFYGSDKFNGSVVLGFKAKGQIAEMNIEMVNASVAINSEISAVNNSTVTLKAVPTVYSLSQNFPNPFNPTTTIEYSIPKAGNATLAIYNIAGQKVRTLVNENQAAAFYKVVWDGRNDNGESVATGMYFYKLVSGNYSKIVKMTLMK